MMNKDTKQWWTKFYMIFGNNGCKNWEDIEKFGLCDNSWLYPDNVNGGSYMQDNGYIDHDGNWNTVRFTQKFIDEILEKINE